MDGRYEKDRNAPGALHFRLLERSKPFHDYTHAACLKKRLSSSNASTTELSDLDTDAT